MTNPTTMEHTPQMPFKLIYSVQLKANVLVDANDVPINVNDFIGAFVDAFNKSEQFEDMKAEIERLKAEQEWISVEDRLPEDGVPVMTYQLNDCEQFQQLVLTLNEGCFCDWDNEGNVNTDGVYLNVTHWKPLPNPPQP